MRLSAILIVSLVALSGCSDDGEATTDDIVFEDLPDEVAADKGVIRGVVVDDTFAPIEGATVTLTGQGLEQITKSDGTFVFTNLDPQPYFMTATKLGWSKMQTSTVVEAGVAKPPIVRMQLVPTPEELPRAVSVTQEGYIGCSFKRPPATTMYNTCANGDLDPDQNVPLTWGETEKPDGVQTELIFKNTQLTGDYLSWIQLMQYEDGRDDERMGNVWGPSPVVCYVNATKLCDNGDGTGGGGGPLNDYEWGDQIWMRVTAACAQGCVPGTAVGVGAAIQQKYQMVGTVFYNIEPVDDWLYATHGPYEV